MTWAETRDSCLRSGPWGAKWRSSWTGSEELTQAKKALPGQARQHGPPEILNAIAARYLDLLTNHAASPRRRRVPSGLNKHALAERRRGLRELSRRPRSDAHPPREGGRSVRDFWAQHIGAVVAASGGDRVTLKLRPDDRDRRPPSRAALLFQMYGSDEGRADVARGVNHRVGGPAGAACRQPWLGRADGRRQDGLAHGA